MVYRHAQNDSFEHLAAGGVIKSFKGHTNFPVRLAHEIFNRCLEYSSKKEDIKLYDPMCGSGYLLTVLGLLNYNTISHLYGSDVKEDVLTIAKQNVALLSKKGLTERGRALQSALDEYQRDSYRLQLEHLQWYKELIVQDLPATIFGSDIFDPITALPKADIIIADLPYNSLVQWGGQFENQSVEHALAELLGPSTVIAIVRTKHQKLHFAKILRRFEKFQVGKRVVEILGKVDD